ncbi:MAG: acylneuraminate cytidylyltransferase family protein [Patescibacteria group bacterium]
MKHRAIAIIPARGGSKRIPKKNVVDIDGKPLIAYTILSAKISKYFPSRIYVSTDDAEIAQTATRYEAKIIKRPNQHAKDKSSTLSVLKHSVEALEEEGVRFDTVVLLQPTSPFRSATTIISGIKKLWGNWDKLDAIFSVKQTKFPSNWILKINKELLEFIYANDFSKIRGQDFDKNYEIDGVLYVYKKDFIKKALRYPFAKNRSGYILTSKLESIDVDDMEDLNIARALFAYKKG